MMRFRNAFLAAAATVALVGGTAGCAGSSAPPQSDTLVLGDIASAAVDFIPTHLLNIIGWHGPLVYDWLIRLDDAERNDSDENLALRIPQPGIATGWSFDGAGTTFTMTVRTGQEFSDGTPVNADTVQQSLNWLMTSDDSLSNLKTSGLFKDVVVSGENEIQIHLNSGMNRDWFFAMLSESGIASPVALDDLDSLAHTPVGSGPYTLDESETTAAVEYTYVRNDDYWDADSFPYETIVVKEFADTVAALNALKSGQIDVTSVDAATADEAKASGFELFVGKGEWFGLMLGGRGDDSPLGDLRVRQAINMAFDREAISQNVDAGYSEPTNQLFTKGQDEFVEGVEDMYPYDPERAKELLADAGYPDGFSLTVPTITGFGDLYQPVIETSLAAIGITVEWDRLVDNVEGYLAGIKDGTYKLFFFQQDSVSAVAFFVEPQDVGGLLTPPTPQDAEIRPLLDQRRNGTEVEQAEAAQEVGRFVFENAWFAPLTSLDKLVAAREGIVITPRVGTGQLPFVQDIRPAS